MHPVSLTSIETQRLTTLSRIKDKFQLFTKTWLKSFATFNSSFSDAKKQILFIFFLRETHDYETIQLFGTQFSLRRLQM